MLLRPLAVSLLSLLAVPLIAVGCRAPLAMTSYPVVEKPSLEGDWSLALKWGSEGDSEGESEDPTLHMTIERIRTKSEPVLLGIFSAKPGPLEPARYRATVQMPASGKSGGATEPLYLDGQVVELDGHSYVTFQKAVEEPTLPIYFLEIPIQNTMRIKVSDNELRFLAHDKRYLWIPLALSGKMEISPERMQGLSFGVLMASLDDVLEAYDAADDKGWNEFAIARRDSIAPTRPR